VTTHMVIPDTQVTPDTPTDHLKWVGMYMVEKKPEVVIHLGDHWDMQSLSSYDQGKIAMEGRRYKEDVLAGNKALSLLDRSLVWHQQRPRKDLYNPRKVLLRGNHEYRIMRTVDRQPQLEGLIGYEHLDTRDWEVHDFLEIVTIDGIAYSHFFAHPMTGNPYGGVASTRLKTIGTSFTMGHQQTLDTAIRYLPNGQQQRGLIAGACYLHDEEYKGPQGNSHWRGILMCHGVEDGAYDIMEVSLDFLCRKYEGVPVKEFLMKKYGKAFS
jgi:hypothetical protein